MRQKSRRHASKGAKVPSPLISTSDPPSFHGCNMRRFPIPHPVRRNASKHKKQGLEPPPPKRKIFVKPNGRSEACFSYAMARNRRIKSKFSLPNLAAYGRIVLWGHISVCLGSGTCSTQMKRGAARFNVVTLIPISYAV